MAIPDKETVRRQIKHVLSAMTTEDREHESLVVCLRLADYLKDRAKMMKEGKVMRVASFAAIRNEVDVMPLLGLFPEIEWYFPRCVGPYAMVFQRVCDPEVDMVPGMMGIREPRERNSLLPSADMLDVVIVPALAFDSQGKRLGKGGGYYDAFLKRCFSVLKLGVCFSCQVIDHVPTDEHDVPVDCVISGSCS